jgi:Flp pilus assembly protein TadG
MKLPMLPRISNLRDQSPRSRGVQITAEREVKLEKVCWPCRRNRRGAAAVEFAVVAPVFFLMIFGMIEFGRMVMVQQILTNASREGARLGVLDNINESDVIQTVIDYTSSSFFGNSDKDLTATTVMRRETVQ